MPDHAEFAHVDDYPEIPVSLRSTRGVLHTGEWRNMRPVLTERAAPCSSACPAGVLIPRCLDLMGRGEIADAYDVFTLRNPFPAITGRVCPHDCEAACNRSNSAPAVSIRALERHLGDRAAHLPHTKPEEETGYSVAVIGSGPAGLAAAYYLRRTGHAVTVFERRERPGGMLRYGIPGYRLPDPYVDAEIDRLEEMGVGFSTGVALGIEVTIEELAAAHHAVFAATGAWKVRRSGMEGEHLLRSGLSFLDEVATGDAVVPGRRCAVVGGGNTAVDVARVLRRLGAEVTVLYRRSEAEMPAVPEEVRRAAAEGVSFRFLSQPRRAAAGESGEVELTVETMTLGAPDHSGRPAPQPAGETTTLLFDAVFSAIGETADLAPFPADLVGDDGWLALGPAGITRRERVFAGGDLATGPATVIEAISAGRAAAAAIHAQLGGGADVPAWADVDTREVVTTGVNPAYIPRHPRLDDHRLSGVGPLEEETATVSPAAALAEIERCYSCGHCNACGTCFVFCPDAAIGWDDGPIFDYDVCKGCGICTAECPGQALVFAREGAYV